MNFTFNKKSLLRFTWSIFGFFSVFFLSVNLLHSQNSTITVIDTCYQIISTDFFGIQYHSNTYNDNNATTKLKKLKLNRVRIWAEVPEFHPAPDIWHWDELDTKIAEITASNFKLFPCLYEGESWFTGSADDPWWNHADALTEWEKAAFEFTSRYKNDLDMITFFDEPNMMHPDRDYYIPFKKCAQLFLRGAQQVKSVNPDILCGGSSSFGGWENGHWANYVLNEPNGKDYLDFISCNLFISWDSNDSDESIMDRTIWYEEAPLKIKNMVGENCPSKLVLDAYNVSAVWKKDGELWTDPRNTNVFGGVYQAAAMLHSAKGGYGITLHWETIGGYGILNWFPEFRELPPYYSWKFLIETTGLEPGAQIIGCETDETPKPDILHHGGMNVNLYVIQPFAIRRIDGGISVILINKFNETNSSATVLVPRGMRSYEIYRYDQNNIENCFVPIEEGQTGQTIQIQCPGLSVSVIRFNATTDVKTANENPAIAENGNLLSNFPNPFNCSTKIRYKVISPSFVKLQIFNMQGQRVRTLIAENKNTGNFELLWDGKDDAGIFVSSGVYLVNLSAGAVKTQSKVLFLK